MAKPWSSHLGVAQNLPGAMRTQFLIRKARAAEGLPSQVRLPRLIWGWAPWLTPLVLPGARDSGSPPPRMASLCLSAVSRPVVPEGTRSLWAPSGDCLFDQTQAVCSSSRLQLEDIIGEEFSVRALQTSSRC